MTTINQANAVYYRVGQLGGGAASAVYAGPTKVWPPPVTYASVVLGTAGLRAYWRMGEASGLIQDSKGTNHASVFGGTPGYGVAGGTTDGNKAISFNGSSWFVVPDANALDFGDWPFSIEFWLKRASLNTTEVFLSKGNQFEVVMDGSNAFYLANGSTPAVWSPTITDTVWHHYVITRAGSAGSTCFVYQDGVDRTGARGGSLFTSNALPWTIGGRGTLRGLVDITLPELDENPDPRVPSYMLVGSLDEIALYNVVLTPAQVLAHWNAR